MDRIILLLVLLQVNVSAQIVAPNDAMSGSAGGDARYVNTTGDTMTGTLNGLLSTWSNIRSGEATITGTMTVQGTAFSVDTSTFVVTAGKVGIGTTTPYGLLDLYQTAYASNADGFTMNTLAGGRLAVYAASNAANPQWYFQSSTGEDIRFYNPNNIMNLWSTGGVQVVSSMSVVANGFSVGTSSFVVASGNVGVGTMNPNTKLHMSSGVITLDGTGAGIALNGIYTEAKSSSTTGSNTTFNVAWSSTSVYEVTLATSTTFTFSGATTGQTMTLKLSQDAQGDRTVTWPSINWGDYGTPVVSTGAYKVTFCSIYYADSTYYGAPCLKGY